MRLKISEIRLVINRFNERKFRKCGFFPDLDSVIDKAGARLLGIVPEDNAAAAETQRGQPPEGKMKAVYAFDRIAARLDGADVPLGI